MVVILAMVCVALPYYSGLLGVLEVTASLLLQEVAYYHGGPLHEGSQAERCQRAWSWLQLRAGLSYVQHVDYDKLVKRLWLALVEDVVVSQANVR